MAHHLATQPVQQSWKCQIFCFVIAVIAVAVVTILDVISAVAVELWPGLLLF